MDIGLRAWLLVLGSLLILGILIHGYWKMRASRNPLKVQLDKSFIGHDDEDDFDLLADELPSSSARILGQIRQSPRPASENRKSSQSDRSRRDPAIGKLNEEEDIPLLMDAVAQDDLPERDEPQSRWQTTATGRRASGAALSGREEKLVIFYLIGSNGTINGQMLLESLVPRDMSFGEMDIFHYKDASGNILFSLANAVEPGSFKLSSIKDIETPGVILFMKAHEVGEPEAAFEEMVNVARGLGEELGCQIRDESQSVVTAQTIEHYRQTIQEYSHRYQ